MRNDLSFTIELRYAYILFERLLELSTEKDERALISLLTELNRMIIHVKEN
jgi:hypothetical protein